LQTKHKPQVAETPDAAHDEEQKYQIKNRLAFGGHSRKEHKLHPDKSSDNGRSTRPRKISTSVQPVADENVEVLIEHIWHVEIAPSPEHASYDTLKEDNKRPPCHKPLFAAFVQEVYGA